MRLAPRSRSYLGREKSESGLEVKIGLLYHFCQVNNLE